MNFKVGGMMRHLDTIWFDVEVVGLLLVLVLLHLMIGCGNVTTTATDGGVDVAGVGGAGVGGAGVGGIGGGVGGAGVGGAGVGGAVAGCTLAADQQSYSCPGCVSTCAKWCSDDTINGASSAACRACPNNPSIDGAPNLGGKVSACGPTGASICCRWDSATLWPYCSGQLVCR